LNSLRFLCCLAVTLLAGCSSSSLVARELILTDPDGHLVGSASGTAVQTLNGVETTTTFTYDPTNGVIPSAPFPYPGGTVPPTP